MAGGVVIPQGVEIEYAVPWVESTAHQPMSLLKALAMWKDCIAPSTNRFTLFLPNGGKAYVDHVFAYDVFELCTPECKDAYECLIYERAADKYAALASEALFQITSQRIHCYKTSITRGPAGSYTTRGTHESYLVDKLALSQIMDLLVPYLVIRPLFTGSGGYYKGKFIISPRQLFVRKVFSDNIHKDRPIIALNKESFAGSNYARLHLCNGEGARCDLTTFLRQGITSLVIRAIERGLIIKVPQLRNPVGCCQRLSQDLNGDWQVELEDGSCLSAIQFLRKFYLDSIEEVVSKSVSNHYDLLALSEFKKVLDALETKDFNKLNRKLDWALKLDIVEGHPEDFIEVDRFTPEVKENLNNQLQAVTDPFFDELEAELGVERLTTEEEVLRAVAQPPEESRALLRCELSKRFTPDSIDWDHITLGEQEFRFPDLSGWNQQRIEETIDYLTSLARKE